MGCFDSKTEETERVVLVGKRQPEKNYKENVVINSKYTILTFFPLIFFTHIRRVMNAYFLLVAILQSIPKLSPVDPLTTWIPIVVIFIIAFLREGYDDIKQHKIDDTINNRIYEGAFDGSIIQEMKSKDFNVGDIIKLKKDEECPVDLIVLQSSDEDGTCNIETANLDGETSLKERAAINATQKYDIFSNPGKIVITCNPPNPDLYFFQGNMQIDGETYPLTNYSFIQSGTKLINTNYIYGVVIYAGSDTKLGLNAQKPPVKWTKIEKFINIISVFIFIAQILLALAVGTYANFYQINYMRYMPYLEITEYSALDWVIMYVRFFLLTTTMIPISLKITLDICKFVYGMWIQMDNNMSITIDPDDEKNGVLHARCTNTSICEDLGAVEYIFSDKTGTLTENVMELQKISANGVLYDLFADHDLVKPEPYFKSKLEFRDEDIMNVVRILALCHTLKIEGKTPIGMSPEEIAFIKGLFKLDFEITQEGKQTTISNPKLSIPPELFTTVCVLPFTYNRKRMSVIVFNEQTKKYLLYSKGSGEVIRDLSNDYFIEFDSHLNNFAINGFRVMAESMKELTKAQVEEFCAAYDELKQDINRTEEQENELFTTLEKNSHLIGLTAIEDKLQTGVPETISMLRDAGIKIWMVTGDIVQTALKISFSTQLIQNDGNIINLSKNDKIPLEKILDTAIAHVKAQENDPSYQYYLVLQASGKAGSLPELLAQPLRSKFQNLAANAKCVVVSQATPSQKADIVDCIQELKKTVLAIGDGGNDITMIRKAQIGVGIIGKEGSQASNAADCAIHQFRFLQRLLLVHGRYANYRTSWLSQFCFYKSTVLSLIQVLYMFVNGFSGASFFSSFNLMCYNAIFTFLPVIFFLQDKDLEENSIFLHPYVYQDSQQSKFCNKRTIFWWYMRAIYQAVITTIIWLFVFTEHHTNNVDGNGASLDEAQQVVYSALILSVLLTVTLDTMHFTAFNFIFIWGTWILYIIIAVCASSISDLIILKEVYLVMLRTISNPVHWCTIMTIVSASIAPPFFIQSIVSMSSPTRTQRIRKEETLQRSKFNPVYLVSRKQLRDDRERLTPQMNPPSIWDKTDSICVCSCCCDNDPFI